MSECLDGNYGLACTQTCGNCKENDICNKPDGVCPTGCTPGYYGGICKDACGNCKAGTVCDDVSGICSGCSAGYKGDMCDQGIYKSLYPHLGSWPRANTFK